MTRDWDSIPEALWPLVAHGVEFTTRSRSQWAGTAPFSEKEGKFYVNPENGLWDEKHLGLRGNAQRFLEEMAKHYQSAMTPVRWTRIARDRGLPVAALKPWGFGWDGEAFILPVKGASGGVRDLKRFNPTRRKLFSTKGCKAAVLGLDRLQKTPPNGGDSGGQGITWVCEGEWDAIALTWWLRRLGRDADRVVGVPGSKGVDADLAGRLIGRKVVCCFDNDDAGDRLAGRAREILRGAGVKARWLNWPHRWSDGWDVRDFIVYKREHNVDDKDAWKKFYSLVGDAHRADDGSEDSSDVEVPDTYVSDDEAPSWEEVLRKYRKYLHMDKEMELALKFIVAVVYSQKLRTKEPLWAYLVAAAGGGKTALLSTLAGHKKTVFRSTVTPNALVSGFKSSSDPSLLPKLTGKTLVVKDFTTTLVGSDFDFEKTMAILRDAFDGEFTQSYGNDVVRTYHGLHFSIIAGVTPAIHAKPQAMMGERFLKLCMRTANGKTRMERLVASIRSADLDEKMDKDLGDTMNRFLSRRVVESDIPVPPRVFLERMAALSQVVSLLRAQVSRDKYDRDLLHYRPEPEVGTRPYRQFIKLAMSLYFALRKKRYDDEILRIVERVALDSCTGFNIEVVRALLGSEDGMTVRAVAEKVGLSYATVSRAMVDLQTLKAVKGETALPQRGQAGRPAQVWKVVGDLLEFWRTACVGRSIERGHSGRR